MSISTLPQFDSTTQDEVLELSDEQLEAVDGGAHASGALGRFLGVGTRIAFEILMNRARR